MDKTYDIVIIGGGISGLYTALKLQKHFKNIALIEQNDRLGGRIHSEKLGNCVVDLGASRFTKKHKILWKLITKYKLTDKLIKHDNQTSYYINDKFIKPTKNTFCLIIQAVNLFYKDGNTALDLMNYTLKEITDKYLTNTEAKWCVDSCPYKQTFSDFNAFSVILFIAEHYNDTF